MRTISDIFRSYGVLDAEGRHVNGTDKMTNHRYGEAYERIFAGYYDPTEDQKLRRNTVKLMMEVGVADGSSLLAWREVFPNAICVGLDIHPSAKAHGDRVEFHLGDATSREACDRAAAGRRFDVIVEDATHRIGDTLQTLYWLWPCLRTGGVYIVEEWEGGSGADVDRIRALFPFAQVVPTEGPFGGIEPLVVLRK